MADLILEVTLPGRPTERLIVDRSPYVLGRQNSCDFVIPAMQVSREHARLTETPDGWHIEDLGGKNGTVLDGTVVKGRQPLRISSVLTLGNTTLKVVAGGSGAAPPPPRDATIVTQTVQSLKEDWLGRDRTVAGRIGETEIIDRLNDLLEISNLLNLALSLEEIFTRVKDVVFRHLKSVERMAVLVDEEGLGRLELKFSCSRHSAALESLADQTWVSRSICQKAFDEAVAIQSSDAQSDARFDGAMSIIDKGIKSAMAVPLWSESKVVGVLYADAQYSLLNLSQRMNEELGFFSALANIVASSIQRWILATKLANESKNREKLERYHSPAVVSQLLAVGEGTINRIDPRDFELTVLMCDLVGFTHWSELLTPKETSELLNHFFDEMLKDVFEAGGTLDKFIGDGIMAFFGAPELQEDHADRAVMAALQMQRHLQELNMRNAFTRNLMVRIGINSGRAVVGDVGSSKRVDYTALGTPVNLASRIEGICPPGQVAISEMTLSLLSDKAGWEDGGEFQLKGVTKPIRIFFKQP